MHTFRFNDQYLFCNNFNLHKKEENVDVLLTIDLYYTHTLMIEFTCLKLQGMRHDLLVKHSIFVIRRTAYMSLVVSDI